MNLPCIRSFQIIDIVYILLYYKTLENFGSYQPNL